MRFVIFKAQAALMGFCQRFRKSQSDTGTCGGSDFIIRHLVEGFKYLSLLGIRYSTTVITHIYLISRISCHEFQIDTRTGIFYRIAHQIHQYLTQLFPIDH